MIAIDGPAGAGKGTVARRLAARLGYRLLDTGAMYRALAWSVARAGLAADETPALRRHVERVQIDLEGDRAIVRDKLTPLQRRLAATGGVVLEGRDTGTVVCPEAEVKFYLDASLEERARRRQAELRTRGIELESEAARREIAARDTQDSSRELAPLRKAADAVEVDTTGLSVEQVVAALAEAVQRRRRDLGVCG